MAAAIRYSLRNAGLTRTNPSVATLIVRDDGEGPVELPEARAAESEPAGPAEDAAAQRDEAAEATEAAPAAPRKSTRTSSRSRSSTTRSKSEKPAPDAAAASE